VGDGGLGCPQEILDPGGFQATGDLVEVRGGGQQFGQGGFRPGVGRQVATGAAQLSEEVASFAEELGMEEVRVGGIVPEGGRWQAMRVSRTGGPEEAERGIGVGWREVSDADGVRALAEWDGGARGLPVGGGIVEDGGVIQFDCESAAAFGDEAGFEIAIDLEESLPDGTKRTWGQDGAWGVVLRDVEGGGSADA